MNNQSPVANLFSIATGQMFFKFQPFAKPEPGLDLYLLEK
jgi:hypothetical protein